MKFFSLASALFLAALTAASGEARGSSPPPLRFEKMPLGNVARVLSARFHTPVAIAANARAPITGDFSALSFHDALAEAARQAGLVVVPLGTDAAAGFCLTEKGGADGRLAPGPQETSAPSPAEVKAGLEAAAQRRAELLRQQAALAQQASGLEPGN